MKRPAYWSGTQMQFITALKELTENPAWSALLPWYRQGLADRIIECTDAAKRNQLFEQAQAASAFLLAIENTVTNNQENIDGRTRPEAITKRGRQPLKPDRVARRKEAAAVAG